MGCCNHHLLFFCRSGKATVPGEAMHDLEVHLSYSDLTVNDSLAPQAISVKIKTSKTDQCRRGYIVVLGRTDNCLCPVSALLSYLALSGNLPGPLSTSKIKHHSPSPSLWNMCKKLSYQLISLLISMLDIASASE